MKAKYVVSLPNPHSTAALMGLMAALNAFFSGVKCALCSANGANNHGLTGYAVSP